MERLATMRITRIELGNWRNFKKAEADLGLRNFFVGPNASGKSNLLDALRFLRDIVVPGGGLGAAVATRGGLPAVRCLQATRNSDVRIAVWLGDDEDPKQWLYEITFNAKKGHPPEVFAERVMHQGKTILDRPNRKDKDDPRRLTQTHLQQINENSEFRDIADALGAIRYLHLVPQIMRDRRRMLVDEPDPHAGDFLSRVKATPARSRDALLKRINEGLGLAVPQFDGLEFRDDEEGRPRLYAKYHHWRPHAAYQSEERFSDGTLRLIGLLWSLGDKSEKGPLLLEEPELGLNDAIVEHLAPLMYRLQARSRRQVVITTHSEALLNSPDVRLSEVFRLEPSENGTIIYRSDADPAAVAMFEAGMGAGEVVAPKVRPHNINQLSLLNLLP